MFTMFVGALILTIILFLITRVILLASIQIHRSTETYILKFICLIVTGMLIEFIFNILLIEELAAAMKVIIFLLIYVDIYTNH